MDAMAFRAIRIFFRPGISADARRRRLEEQGRRPGVHGWSAAARHWRTRRRRWIRAAATGEYSRGISGLDRQNQRRQNDSADQKVRGIGWVGGDDWKLH